MITGGLGFIGSNLAGRLVDFGAKVTLVDSLIPEFGGNLFNISSVKEQLQVNISDVRDIHSLTYLIKDKDFIFNLAGQTSHMDSMADPYTDMDINCRSQLSILETCRKVNPSVKVLFASTRQIYGKPQYLPVDEEHLLDPVDVNGINKVAAEHYHALYSKVYSLDTVSLRLTNTYGPRMRVKDARQTFLGIWIKKIIENQPFEVWGGEQIRDYNYIDDVTEAMLLAISKENRQHTVYNLGHHETLNLQESAEQMIEVAEMGSFEVIKYPEERRKIDIGDYYSDYERFKLEMNWTPKTSFKEGMGRTFEYYKKYLQHYE